MVQSYTSKAQKEGQGGSIWAGGPRAADARRCDSAGFSGNSKKDRAPGLPRTCGEREREPALERLLCKQNSSDFIWLLCRLGRVMLRFVRCKEGGRGWVQGAVRRPLPWFGGRVSEGWNQVGVVARERRSQVQE